MKFSSAALGSALLASTALAAPLTAQRQARNADRHSQPPMKSGRSKNVQYSSNWAGAVQVGSGYTSVTAEFIVPKPSIPPGGNTHTQYCASAWVGIDGDTCQTAILQTGLDFCIQGTTVTYDAWYEWYPDYAYDFTGITINTGDNVRVTVDASSTTSGTATIENLTTGQTVQHTFTGQTSGSLCETNAEWIVEDFMSGGRMVPFADFGTVHFTNAYATDNGSQVGTSGSQIMDIEQKGVVLTSVSVGANDVTVQYV